MAVCRFCCTEVSFVSASKLGTCPMDRGLMSWHKRPPMKKMMSVVVANCVRTAQVVHLSVSTCHLNMAHPACHSVRREVLHIARTCPQLLILRIVSPFWNFCQIFLGSERLRPRCDRGRRSCLPKAWWIGDVRTRAFQYLPSGCFPTRADAPMGFPIPSSTSPQSSRPPYSHRPGACEVPATGHLGQSMSLVMIMEDYPMTSIFISLHSGVGSLKDCHLVIAIPTSPIL